MAEFLYYEVISDGKLQISFKCPDCGEWGYIDEDQFNGKVSIFHENCCKFHQTINIRQIGRKISVQERFNLKK